MGVSHETCLVYVSQGSVYCLSDSIREIRLVSCAFPLAHLLTLSSLFSEPRWRMQTCFQRGAVPQAPATEAEAYFPGPGSTSMRRRRMLR